MKMSGKIYKIGFFVLLIINIAFVTLIVIKRPPNRQDMRERLSKRLGFDESQKETFIAMADGHRAEIDAIDKRESELIKSYFGLILSPDSTSNKEMMLEEIQSLKKEKLLITYEHFDSLKAICNQDQLAEFEEFMNRVIPMISRGPRHRMRRSR